MEFVRVSTESDEYVSLRQEASILFTQSRQILYITTAFVIVAIGWYAALAPPHAIPLWIFTLFLYAMLDISAVTYIICKIYPRCLQFGRIKIIDKLFHGCLIIDSLVRLDGIVPVHESDQFLPAMCPRLEYGLLMPHLHQCPDHPFRLAVGLWGSHLRKSLLNMIEETELHEGVVLTATILQSVVRVHLFNRVRTFIQYLLEKRFCRVLRLVRKDCRVQFT